MKAQRIIDRPETWIARTAKDWKDMIIDLDLFFLNSKEKFENYQKQKNENTK